MRDHPSDHPRRAILTQVRLPIQQVDAFAGPDVDFVSRFFAPAAGGPEDPVPGSAHCTLAPYWARRSGKNLLRARRLSLSGGELIRELVGDRVLLRKAGNPLLIRLDLPPAGCGVHRRLQSAGLPPSLWDTTFMTQRYQPGNILAMSLYSTNTTTAIKNTSPNLKTASFT